jgi:glycosyltransferase involved in cell wall biosynthesis
MKLKIAELRFGLRSSLTLLNKEGTELELKVPLIKGDLGGSKPLFTNSLSAFSTKDMDHILILRKSQNGLGFSTIKNQCNNLYIEFQFMKILHLNISDYSASGGTGIAMHRLHTALRSAGHDSKILCMVKQFQEPESIYLNRSLPTKAIERLLHAAETPLALKDSSRILTAINLRNHPLYQEADVITLHCIHDNFLSYLGLPWLTQKPTVYYIHDMWAFTGQCHYSYECDRWQTGCGECPHLGTLKHDRTHLEWQLKKWAYDRSKLHLITASTWTEDRIRQSMLKSFPLFQIPHSINTDLYHPSSATHCREVLGLPLDKKILMFGAQGLQDFRKGGDLLVEALRGLPTALKAETVLITMGGQDSHLGTVDIPTFNFGFIEDDRLKATLYAAADVFLFPTRHETFGLVSIESMACGTPVVAFDVGGVSGAVRPEVTGLLAAPENVSEFRLGIVRLLTDEALRTQMSRQCREVILQEYADDLLAPRHLEVYEQAVRSHVVKMPGELRENNLPMPCID